MAIGHFEEIEMSSNTVAWRRKQALNLGQLASYALCGTLLQPWTDLISGLDTCQKNSGIPYVISAHVTYSLEVLARTEGVLEPPS